MLFRTFLNTSTGLLASKIRSAHLVLSPIDLSKRIWNEIRCKTSSRLRRIQISSSYLKNNNHTFLKKYGNMFRDEILWHFCSSWTEILLRKLCSQLAGCNSVCQPTRFSVNKSCKHVWIPHVHIRSKRGARPENTFRESILWACFFLNLFIQLHCSISLSLALSFSLSLLLFSYCNKPSTQLKARIWVSFWTTNPLYLQVTVNRILATQRMRHREERERERSEMGKSFYISHWKI